MLDLGHQSPQTILVKKMGKIPVIETVGEKYLQTDQPRYAVQTTPLSSKVIMIHIKWIKGRKATLKFMWRDQIPLWSLKIKVAKFNSLILPIPCYTICKFKSRQQNFTQCAGWLKTKYTVRVAFYQRGGNVSKCYWRLATAGLSWPEFSSSHLFFRALKYGSFTLLKVKRQDKKKFPIWKLSLHIWKCLLPFNNATFLNFI